ncbi:hypothetical protein E4T50_07588 [Aureobasidium sp. EXF-12298]|nr:hypothetical protein E4T50_07588 [Aureobasidium sp. EXF-12298]KAI4759829.1 hypothetical protein E4T51_07133 [Aureobasidium sp. EXF-12344]KAI4772118.1 hypothetical protein E4T52_12891 [Aureobasidium sp. EXF-3400]
MGLLSRRASEACYSASTLESSVVSLLSRRSRREYTVVSSTDIYVDIGGSKYGLDDLPTI